MLSFAPSDLKNMYQDEYLLGFETSLAGNWMLGAKLTFRDLKSAIDDICDPSTMEDVLEDRGIDLRTVEIPFCFMFNPGGENTFSLANIDEDGAHTGTRTEVTMTSDDWRFPDPMKRDLQGPRHLRRATRSMASGKRASTTPTARASATWKAR